MTDKLLHDNDLTFKIAGTHQEFNEAKELFQQYAATLGIDLSFQHFAEELKTIEQQYYKPNGALLLVYKDKRAVGCIGIRQLDNDTAELKRMFVQDNCRNMGIGTRLLEAAIQIAQSLHYKVLRLDTLPTMIQAQKLYRSFGFYAIPPYRFNPVGGTVFMEKKLG